MLEEQIMRPVYRKIDFSKVKKVVYHIPDGDSIVFAVEGVEHIIDFSRGRICDTSEANGVIHFFPRGLA